MILQRLWLDFVDYCKSCLIRAAVEREFITIGEALIICLVSTAACSPASTRLHESSVFAISSPTNTTGLSLPPLRAIYSDLIDNLSQEEC
jgi:hypothetical protein